MARKFEIVDAVRENVTLLLGLSGASGGGKTASALLLAHGIQDIVGGDICFIDTDNGRGLQYAGVQIEGASRPFKFKYLRMDPPYGSMDYIDAMKAAEALNPGVIVVDQMSNEHSGEGGHLDAHEAELERMAGKDFRKREAVKMLAWGKPKAQRNKLLQHIQRLDTHTIFCFRAKTGVKPVTVGGKTEFVQQGFTPIAADEFVFEMTLNALLLPNSGGVATWNSEFMGERLMTKLPEQFKQLRGRTTPIDEKLGRQFAQWAQGGAPKSPRLPVVEAGESEGPSASDEPKEAAPAEAPRPQEPKTVPSVEEPKPTAESATPASTSSPTETSSQENTSAPSSDGEKVGQSPQEPSSTNEGAPKLEDPETPPAAKNTAKETAFHDYARAVAEANDWPQIDHALGVLRKTADWTSAQKPQQEMARRIAFTRLKELTDAGYKFSVTTDMQAWRCYISWETKQATLLERRSLVAQTPAWMALDTPSKIAMDKAFEARIITLKAEQGETT